MVAAARDEVEAHDDELATTPRVFMLSKPFSLQELETTVQQALGEPVDVGTRDTQRLLRSQVVSKIRRP